MNSIYSNPVTSQAPKVNITPQSIIAVTAILEAIAYALQIPRSVRETIRACIALAKNQEPQMIAEHGDGWVECNGWRVGREILGHEAEDKTTEAMTRTGQRAITELIAWQIEQGICLIEVAPGGWGKGGQRPTLIRLPILAYACQVQRSAEVNRMYQTRPNVALEDAALHHIPMVKNGKPKIERFKRYQERKEKKARHNADEARRIATRAVARIADLGQDPGSLFAPLVRDVPAIPVSVPGIGAECAAGNKKARTTNLTLADLSEKLLSQESPLSVNHSKGIVILLDEYGEVLIEKKLPGEMIYSLFGIVSEMDGAPPLTGAKQPTAPAEAEISSKYKGVAWEEKYKMWKARLTCRGQGYHLGYFQDEEEAARAYDAKAIELLGKKAKLNFSNSPDPKSPQKSKIGFATNPAIFAKKTDTPLVVDTIYINSSSDTATPDSNLSITLNNPDSTGEKSGSLRRIDNQDDRNLSSKDRVTSVTLADSAKIEGLESPPTVFGDEADTSEEWSLEEREARTLAYYDEIEAELGQREASAGSAGPVPEEPDWLQDIIESECEAVMVSAAHQVQWRSPNGRQPDHNYPQDVHLACPACQDRRFKDFAEFDRLVKKHIPSAERRESVWCRAGSYLLVPDAPRKVELLYFAYEEDRSARLAALKEAPFKLE